MSGALRRTCCGQPIDRAHLSGCTFEPRPGLDYSAPAVEPSAICLTLHGQIVQGLAELDRIADETTGSAWRQWGMSLHASPDGQPDNASLDDSAPVAHFQTMRDGHPRTHDMAHVQQWQPKVTRAITAYWRAQADGWLVDSAYPLQHELAMRRLAGMVALLQTDLGVGR